MSTTHRARRTAAVALAAVAALALLLPAGAGARLIANPSPGDFFAEIQSGYLLINGCDTSTTPCTQKRSLFKLDFGALGKPNPSLRGTIDSSGNIVFPQAQVVFPPLDLPPDSSGGIIHVQILPTAPWTGVINPLTGRVDLDAKMRIQLTGTSGGQSLGNGCYIASAGSPLDIVASTHSGTQASGSTAALRPVTFLPIPTEDPPFLGGTMTGQAYSDEAGTWPGEIGDNPAYVARPAGSMRVVNDTFQVGTASGCAALNLGNGPVNSQLGLPANSGNAAALDVVFVEGGARTGINRYVQKGVKANFTAPGVSTATWPADEIPQIPTSVATTIDGSSSFFAAGPNAGGRFAWDTGSGTFGAFENTSAKVISFATTGTKTIRLKARDVDGDTDTRTRQVQVIPSTDIAVTASAPAGTFRAGSNGLYRLNVTNTSATQANTQPITLSDTLPSGTSFVSATGTGWSCGNSGATVTCTRATGTLAAGASSSVDVTVAVAATAPASLSNTGTVAQLGDANSANDSSTIQTPVTRTDLKITKTHTGTFTANGVWSYTIGVSNIGDADTVGATTVVDTLPVGVTYRATGSGGTGWSCGAAGQTVTCTYAGTIAASGSTADLTITVKVDATAGGTLTNSATVSTQGDADAFGGANTATDDTPISVVPDLTVSSSHTGAFTVGSVGTYTITVANESVLDADGPTTVSYDLPSGLTVSAVSGTNWDCSATAPGDGHVSCAYADPVVAGDVAPDLTLVVDVGHAAYPAATNSPVVSNDNDGNAYNNSSDDPTVVHRLDVAISNTALRSFSVGIDGTYRLSVSNVGDADTVGPTTVLDELPDTVHLKSVTGAGWNCGASIVGAQHVECVRTSPITAGTAAPLISVRVTVLDQAAADGDVVNTATVDTDRDTRSVPADAPVTGNNTDTSDTPAVSVDVSIASQHVGSFPVDQTPYPEYALKIRNVGAIPTAVGAAITVVDQLPDGVLPDMDNVVLDRAGWHCAADVSKVTCSVEAPDDLTSVMQPGDTASIIIPVDVTDASAATGDNVATISTSKDDDVVRSPNNRSTDATTFNRIDTRIAATQTIQPRAAGIGEVSLDVDNHGTADTIAPTTVTVPLASGVSYRPAGSTVTGWACSSAGAGTSIVCEHPETIAAGSHAEPLALRENVSTGAPASWDTTATVAADGEPVTRLDDNTSTASATLKRVDLTLTKTHGASSVHAGSRAVWTLVVHNGGNLASSTTTNVDDQVDPGFDRPRASGPGWVCSTDDHLVHCTRTQPIAAGADAPAIKLIADVPTSTSGTRDSSPKANVSSTDDPYTGDDSAADPTQVITSADFKLEMQQPAGLHVGDLATIAFRVTNVGVETADGSPTAHLHDDLPAGLTPVSSQSSDNWDCDLAGGAVDCDLNDPLDPGQTTVVNVRVRVNLSAYPETGSLGSIKAGSAGIDPNPFNDTFIATSTVDQRDIALTAESPSPDGFQEDVSGTFKVFAENVGDAPTTGPLRIVAPMSAGESFVDTGVFGNGWDCRLVGDNVNCSRDATLAPGVTAPPLQLTVAAHKAAAPTLHSSFSVSTDGDQNPANDVATLDDTVTLRPVPTDTTPTDTTPTTTTPVTGTPLAGQLTSGSITLGSLAPVTLDPGQLTVSGSVNPDGSIAIPKDGIKFRTLSLPIDAPPLSLNAKLIFGALGDATGSLPPGGGTAHFSLPVQVKIEAALTNGTPLLGTTSNCYVTPVQFDLSGPYDAAAKTVVLSSDSLGIPTAGDGCGALGSQVNSLLGLPSSTNKITLTLSLNGVGTTTGPDTTTTPPPPTNPFGTAGFGDIKKAKASKNSLVIPVTCTGGDQCSGRLLASIKVRNAKRKLVTHVIATGHYGLNGVTTANVKALLTKEGRTRIKSAGAKGLKMKLTLVPSGKSKASGVGSLTVKSTRSAARSKRAKHTKGRRHG